MKVLVLLTKFLKYIILIAVSVYLLLNILLFFFQEKLLFFPSSPYIPHYEKIRANPTLKNYIIKTPDGYILDGWMQIDKKNEKTILYFGGNGDEVSYFVEKHQIQGANIIAFNYRGYAYSTGKPSEKVLFGDAMQIYDFLIQDLHISPENIFIMGRSLGTGVATYLASQKSSAGVILVTPYDSVENVAKGSYWFVPVSILLKNKFESYRYAQLQANSLLCIYGGLDYTIPNQYTENLLMHWNGGIKRILVETANHDNIYSFNQVQESIERFVK